jgi:hypothetical protein
LQVILRRAHQVMYHLQNLGTCEAAARAQFNTHVSRVTPNAPTLYGSSPLVECLVIELSEAFAALRILQNESWQFLTAAFGVLDAPPSMRDAFKAMSRPRRQGEKRARWMARVPQEAAQAVMAYWRSCGELVATYRDVDQHHDILARGCKLILADGRISKVVIWLPDNPTVVSARRFTYETDVDGAAFVQSGFEATHVMLEDIAKAQGAGAKPLAATIDLQPAIRHEPGVNRSTALFLWDRPGEKGLLLGQDAEMHVTLASFSTAPP